MTAGNFAFRDRVFSFSQLLCLFFWEKQIIYILRNSRFPVRSVFVINESLLTSVVCYCQNDNEENIENARYATNGDTPL
jgi:hypothetical protein